MHIINLLIYRAKDDLFDVALQATLAGDFIKTTFSSSLPFTQAFASSYSKGLNSVVQSATVKTNKTTSISCLVDASYNGNDQYLRYTGSKDWTGNATPTNCEVVQDTNNPNLLVFSNFTPSTSDKTTACNVVLLKYDYIEEGKVSYFGYDVKYTPYWVFSKAGKWSLLMQVDIDGEDSPAKLTLSLTVQANTIYTDEIYAQKHNNEGSFSYTLPFYPGMQLGGGSKESFTCSFTWSYAGEATASEVAASSDASGSSKSVTSVDYNDAGAEIQPSVDSDNDDTQSAVFSTVREISLTPLMHVNRARKLTVI